MTVATLVKPQLLMFFVWWILAASLNPYSPAPLSLFSRHLMSKAGCVVRTIAAAMKLEVGKVGLSIVARAPRLFALSPLDAIATNGKTEAERLGPTCGRFLFHRPVATIVTTAVTVERVIVLIRLFARPPLAACAAEGKSEARLGTTLLRLFARPPLAASAAGGKSEAMMLARTLVLILRSAFFW